MEPRILGFWQRTRAYQRTKEMRGAGKDFYLLDAPSFTAGKFHIGLVFNKTLKDAFLRYQRMSSFNVRDRPGFDTHGLPIELEVEAKLGIEGKRRIEDVGAEKFVERCIQHSRENAQAMAYQFEDLGIWMDWGEPYQSSSLEFIDSVWWTFKKAHAKGLITWEEQVVPWCPRCGTALASFEVEHSTIRATTAYLKFPIKGRKDEYILVWTAQPWTVVANLAIAVNPSLRYVRVRVRKKGKREVLIMLEDTVEAIASQTGIEAYEILGDAVNGEELKGLEYFHPLMSDIPFHREVSVRRVLPSTGVNAERTGAIHVAPGHCYQDYLLARETDLPIFSPLDEKGVLTSEAGLKYGGLSVQEANERVISDFDAMHFLLHREEAEYRHGRCAYCSEPLVYRLSKEWFFKVAELKEGTARALGSVSWIPERIGSSWIYSTIEPSDWCISKKRFWGIPVPVWVCLTDVCGNIEALGSLKDLKDSPRYKEGLDPHRPWIDRLTLTCSKCGGIMERVHEVLDVGFESSVASWAQLGYPSKKSEFKRWWPCDLTAEGRWQMGGWFYPQLCLSTAVFDRSPYKTALVHGRLTLMHPGDADPLIEAVSRYGRDALRLHILQFPPWEHRTVRLEEIATSMKTIRVLWNVFLFAARHMAIDGFEPRKADLQKILERGGEMERWLLSRLDALTAGVGEAMNKMELHRAVALISRFILHDVSRWYGRVVRSRVWTEGGDREIVYGALSETLLTLVKLLAPFTPFLAEEIYQCMDGRLLSVHMCDMPRPVEGRRNPELEREMEVVRGIVSAVWKARHSRNRGLRWPVRTVTIEPKEKVVVDAVERFRELLSAQMNAKNIEVVPLGEEWSGLELKAIPNPAVIGKAYKQWEPMIARMLEARPARKIKEDIAKGVYQLGIEGQLIKILPEMVAFVAKLPKDVVSAEFDQGVVYIDVSEDEELRAEGFAREIIRRIQEMRKEMGTEVEEYVRVAIAASGDMQEMLGRWSAKIEAETMCRELTFDTDVDEDYVVEWNIRGATVVIGLSHVGLKAALDDFMRVPGMTKTTAIALFDAGYTDLEMAASAQREDLIKVAGVSHGLIRRMKEYREMPVSIQPALEITCPTCSGTLDTGTVECPRCGTALIPTEAAELLEEPEELPADLEEAIEATISSTPIPEPGVDEAAEIEEILEEAPPRAAEPRVEEAAAEIDEILEERAPPRPAESRVKEAAAEIDEILEEAPPRPAEPRMEKAADIERVEEKPVPPRAAEPRMEKAADIEKIEEKPVPPRPAEPRMERAADIEKIEEKPVPPRPAEPKVEKAADIERVEEKPVPPRAAEPRMDTVAKIEEAEERAPPRPAEARVEKAAEIEEVEEAPPRAAEPKLDEAAETEALTEKVERAERPAAIVEAMPSAAPAISEGRIEKDVIIAGKGVEREEVKQFAVPLSREEFIQWLSELAKIHISLARALYDGGFDTLDKLQSATEADLRGVERVGKVTARKILATFKPTEEVEASYCTLCNAILPKGTEVCPRCGGGFGLGEGIEVMTEKVEKRMLAMDAIDKKLETSPENPDILYSKAMTHLDMGDVAEARRILGKVLSLAPEHGRALAALAKLAVPAEALPQPPVSTPEEIAPEPSQEKTAVEEEPQELTELRESFTYLVKEERPLKSYALLRAYADRGMNCFCVTRNYPVKVRERHGLKDVPILWLSNVGKEDSVRPKDLEKLSLSLEQFLSRQGGLVLLDGIEYLITNNNFITVLRLIQSLRDQVAINRSVLLLSVNPSTLNVNELNLLEREVDAVIG
ncbi:MAG: isoleucine--tRNA ligase [Candidatus Thermoplasmatota archaeon]